MTDEGDRRSRAPARSSGGVRLERRKTISGGQTRQSFSHGRTKVVQVEVKKRHVIRPGRGDAKPEAAAPTPAPPSAKPVERPAASAPAKGRPRAPLILKTLTPEERESRMRALSEARKLEEEARRQAEAEAALRSEEEARIEAEREEARRQAEAEAERRQREEEARQKAEEQASRLAEPRRGADPAPPATTTARPEEEEARRPRRERRSPLAPKTRPGDRRRRGKLTVAQALAGDDGEERARSLAAARRAREKLRQQQAGQRSSSGPARKFQREIVVPEAIPVGELANRMAVRGGEVVKRLMELGQMVTINQAIDADTAELLVEEFGHKARRVSAADVEVGLKQDDDAEELKRPRPPVVTVMGHVDHGKTSLLDALRKTDVAAGEAGGITQHIGAHRVELAGAGTIMFLDTPGHAAFTAMRARGADVTDIVVLVVAADDSVMPQTREAIDHARAAAVPLVVAINKCDLPGADPGKVRQDLLQHELVVEAMGGEVLDVEVSAKTGAGLDKLKETILLQAELLELRANPERAAEGVVVEARLEKGRGAVSTVLVQRGTLSVGDIVVVGREWGRIRALVDDRGAHVKAAGPAAAVEVLGLSGTPAAGDEFVAVENERRAREIAAYREEQERQRKIATVGRSSVEQLLASIAAGQARELALVVKADVDGSAEAIAQSLEQLGGEEVRPRVLLAAVGGINESDVTLAKASNAIVFGFNVRANSQARRLAEKEGVELRYHRIIYELLDEAETMLSGLLAPVSEEKVLGAAQVLETFDISKLGRIAGCRIMDGVVRRNAKVRLLRAGHILFDGAIASLRHHKDEVREIKQGSECGIRLEGHQDIEVGDEIEAYERIAVARSAEA